MKTSQPPLIPYQRPAVSDEDMRERAHKHYRAMTERRSCRHFSDRPVPREVIENLILTASSAPSGAHKQPWSFVAVADPKIKSEIRSAAENEERHFYEERASEAWLRDLAPLGTDAEKPFLDTAPWLIVVFKKLYEPTPAGKAKNYYVQESVGIACGFLISAIHQAGLVTLTHTPSPMNFLADILQRPAHEKPFLLLPVGHPAPEARVPDLRRRSLDEIAVFL